MKTILLSLLLLFFLKTHSQQANLEILSTSGDYAEFGNYACSWTIGEGVIEVFRDGKNYFTQGFHQPLNEKKDLEYFFPEDSIHITVFPIPAQENIFIEIAHSEQDYGGVLVEILDANYQILITKEIYGLKDEIPISYLAAGIYILRFISANNQTVYACTIIKI